MSGINPPRTCSFGVVRLKDWAIRVKSNLTAGATSSSLAFIACVIACCFFFQAEDGIRDLTVTGVQTCALPIYFQILNALLRLENDCRFVHYSMFRWQSLAVRGNILRVCSHPGPQKIRRNSRG